MLWRLESNVEPLVNRLIAAEPSAGGQLSQSAALHLAAGANFVRRDNFWFCELLPAERNT
jgi:hypothetical protein